MENIYKSAGVIIEDKKLLVSRSKGKSFFISPGGKRKEGEPDKQALIRELGEELSIEIKESDLEDLGTWSAEAAGTENTIVHMHVFIVKSYEGNITPTNEIEEIKWVSSSNLETIELGSIFKHDVFPKLKELGMVN